jgi:phage head maturation protease
LPEQILTRAAQTAGSVDVEARTVGVIIASETPVRRRSWQDGPFDEILLCTPQAVDLGRTEAMAVLDSHDAYTNDSRIGSVIPGSVTFERGRIAATIKLGSSPRADAILADLAAGHRYGVSAGYRINASEREEAPTGGIATVRATAWELLEVSLVSVPADATARTRSISTEVTMPEELETETRYQPNNIINERTRAKHIRELGKRAGLDQSTIDTAVDAGTTVEAFRAAMFDKLVERQSRTPTFPHVETSGMEGNQTRAQAMADALLIRVDPSHKPKSDSGQYRGLTLVEVARECLTANGEFSARGMSPTQVFERALHGNSDFPIVIGQIGQTVLAQRYQAVQSPLKIVARKAIASNFKPKTSVQLSGFSDLEEVTEHGEYKRGTFKEGAESYRIRSFGKVFGLSFEALINDELGAFADVTRDLAAAAARLEADIIADLLNDNPIMSDGRTVFDTYHLDKDGKHLPGNVVPGAELSVANLEVARLKLRQQVGLAGELIDVVPKYLIVGIENESTGERVLSAVQANQTDDINIFAGRLQLVVDRRIAGGAWYLAADPNLTPGLEYAHLAGYEGPQFAWRVGFDTDGFETRVSHRFGAGWQDYRSWVKNPGA